MKTRLTYYGQKERDVELFIGDLFKFCMVDGRQGRGLLLGFEKQLRGFQEVDVLKFLTDKGVEEQRVTMFFRIERLHRMGD